MKEKILDVIQLILLITIAIIVWHITP